MFQSKLCESPVLGSACCACEKTTQDFFFFFFPFQGDKWERGSASETLCWTNISHWSTPRLRYWYSLQSLDPGYKTHPLSSCSSWMAGSSYTPPLLQTHTQTHTHTHTTLALITDSTFIISRGFRCVGWNWRGLFLITLFLARPSHLEVY